MQIESVSRVSRILPGQDCRASCNFKADKAFQAVAGEAVLSPPVSPASCRSGALLKTTVELPRSVRIRLLSRCFHVAGAGFMAFFVSRWEIPMQDISSTTNRLRQQSFRDCWQTWDELFFYLLWNLVPTFVVLWRMAPSWKNWLFSAFMVLQPAFKQEPAGINHACSIVGTLGTHLSHFVSFLQYLSRANCRFFSNILLWFSKSHQQKP